MYSRSIKAPKSESFFLFGPRGVGKTAWLLTNFPKSLYFDLLDSAVFNDLIASPQRLEALIPKNFQDWIVIDEVQRVPQILNEVHRLIERKKLKFILTGSSVRKLRREGGNLLAGRAITKYMHPLTAIELADDFDLKHAIKFGCLPSVFTKEDPAAYLSSYVTTYLREEVQQEGITRNISAFARFLESSSFSQALPLNMAAVGRDASIKAKTAEEYFNILEDLLLAVRVPIFSRRAKRKLISHPKFMFFDSGIYRAVRPKGPLDSESEIDGAALETLFFQQLRAENDYGNLGYEIYYWRSQQKEEVDFVLYGEKGLLAFEVKKSDRIRPDDLKGLKLFATDYPKAKTYILYFGEREWEEDGILIRNYESVIRNLKKLLSA